MRREKKTRGIPARTWFYGGQSFNGRLFEGNANLNAHTGTRARVLVGADVGRDALQEFGGEGAAAGGALGGHLHVGLGDIEHDFAVTAGTDDAEQLQVVEIVNPLVVHRGHGGKDSTSLEREANWIADEYQSGDWRKVFEGLDEAGEAKPKAEEGQ